MLNLFPSDTKITLSQGMYSNLSCNTFGLMYAQNRSDEVIRNAGWFNKQGEKLGWGDLSLKDLDNISALLPDGELFIVLSEANSNWNMPNHIDRFVPGIDYVMQKAAWVVSAFKATNDTIYCIKDQVVIGGASHKVNASYLITNNFNAESISHYEITRDKLFQVLGYNDTVYSFTLKPVNVVLKPDTYYGLPIYECSEGELFALAKDGEIHSAMTLKIKENICYTNLKYLKNFIAFYDDDIKILEKMTDSYGPQTNNIFKTMLGNYLNNYINDEVLRRSPGDILANYDGKEQISDDIDGLPKGYYAYRID